MVISPDAGSVVTGLTIRPLTVTVAMAASLRVLEVGRRQPLPPPDDVGCYAPTSTTANACGIVGQKPLRLRVWSVCSRALALMSAEMNLACGSMRGPCTMCFREAKISSGLPVLVILKLEDTWAPKLKTAGMPN